MENRDNQWVHLWLSKKGPLMRGMPRREKRETVMFCLFLATVWSLVATGHVNVWENECICMNGVNEWSIRPWLPSDYVNGQKRAFLLWKKLWMKRNQRSIRLWTDKSECGPLRSEEMDLCLDMFSFNWLGTKFFCGWQLACPYYAAQNDYTHTFIIWEFDSKLHRTSVSRAFWQEFFSVIRAPP